MDRTTTYPCVRINAKLLLHLVKSVRAKRTWCGLRKATARVYRLPFSPGSTCCNCVAAFEKSKSTNDTPRVLPKSQVRRSRKA